MGGCDATAAVGEGESGAEAHAPSKRWRAAILASLQDGAKRSKLEFGSRQRPLALFSAGVYFQTAVKQPFINVGEKIDRFVGRRTKTPDALSTATSNKANSIAWRKAFGGLRVQRGVFRFNTHEEADQWLWQMIARPRN